MGVVLPILLTYLGGRNKGREIWGVNVMLVEYNEMQGQGSIAYWQGSDHKDEWLTVP